MKPTEKTFVLFAADEVGLLTAGLLVHDKALKLVVLSHDAPRHFNERLQTLCDLNKVPCVMYKSGEFSAFTTCLRGLRVDYFLLAWWPKRLTAEELGMAKVGVLNFHPSYLPWCRGKHPSFWAILQSVPFGVTIHWCTERLDAGDIAFQRQIRIPIHSTAQDLYEFAKLAMLQLFSQSWPRIRLGDIPRFPNVLRFGSYHEAAEIEEASRIDLDHVYSGRALLNLLRARTFPGHPGAWFEDENGLRYEVRVTINAVTETLKDGAKP